MKYRLSLLLSLGFCTLSQGIFLTPTIAQVTPDGTTNTTVDVSGNDFTINQGDRAGDNLFHSFRDFSVPTDGSAFFNNAADIANIFSRVTGGNISDINGLLRANGTASLFLINPAGIIFGEGARLDIGGSFYGSTADSIVFADGEFSASNLANPPVLTINAPIGLNFRDNPGDIINRSVADDVGLQVPSGKNFTLFGGNINLEAGKITAPGGIINLGGLSAAGEITINSDGSLVFPDGVIRSDVSLSDQAEANVQASGGGFINVNARNLTLSDGSLLSGGIAENTGSVNAQAGDITINTTSVTARGNSIISTATNTNGVGNAGNINITTNTLEFNDEFSSEELTAQFDKDDFSSRLVASTFGQGNGGNITVNAAGDVSFDGSGGGIFSTVGIRANDDVAPNVKGDAGNILVDANSVSIIDGAGFIVSTIGEGNGGNITVNARDTITMGGLGDPIPKFNNVIRSSGLKTQVRGEEDVTPNSKEKAGPGIGNGGTIEINTNVLSASQVAIVADSTGGNSGNININANDSILVNGSLVNGSLLSTRINDNAVGNAGSIGLNTNILSLNNASILTDTLGQGNAGDFIIEATEVTIEKSNILSQSRLGARGNGGSVHINVLNDIFLRNSQIATQVLDNVVGNSGNIDINAKSLLTQGTQILVDNQGAGNSGNITINTTGSIVFDSLDRSPQGAPTKILTQLQSDVEKQGGRITITGAEISLNNFAQISANTAQGSVGEPGNITLNADGKVSITNGSLIDALTENDFDGGNINIIASFLELKNGGKLVTGAEGNSNAGDITLNISGDIILNNGSPPESTITFNEPILENLKFQTGIFANNSPNSTGDGGNIVITADSIKFEDRGFISVNTFTGEGGTINLTVNDTIFLQNNSLISAEAEGIGNGGNITINTNFIVAFPNQNSDILTRAAQKGEGGDIDITAEALFGIQERSSTPPNETNDIDASSEFGLDGSVSISTPDTNRIQTDIKLPDSTIEAERTVAQACQGDRYGGISSNLTVKGKGGVSPTPIDPLYSDEILVDNQELTIISNLETQYPNIKPIQTSLGDIYPARGIIKTEEGNIILTAYPNNNTNIRTPHNSNCN